MSIHPDSHMHMSPIGGGSDEDNEIYLSYYPDFRASAEKDSGRAVVR